MQDMDAAVLRSLSNPHKEGLNLLDRPAQNAGKSGAGKCFQAIQHLVHIQRANVLLQDR